MSKIKKLAVGYTRSAKDALKNNKKLNSAFTKIKNSRYKYITPAAMFVFIYIIITTIGSMSAASEIKAADANGGREGITAKPFATEFILGSDGISGLQGLSELPATFIVDGKHICTAVNETSVKNVIEKLRMKEAKKLDAAFVTIKEDITFEQNIFFYSNLTDGAELEEAILNNITFIATKTVNEITQIPFKTTKKQDNTLTAGTSKIVTRGEQGELTTIYRIVFENGVQISKTVVFEGRTKEPVNAVILEGIKKEIKEEAKEKNKEDKEENNPPKSTEKPAQNENSTFVFPVARGTGVYISAYWGDGRGHRAYDIAAPKGTAIYAAQGGTVVSAGYLSNGYGNTVIIDHGNGMQTLYAHCSALYVSAGETVEAGQEIAAVGRTGNATGNHLHFEVIINGVRVSPGPYLP